MTESASAPLATGARETQVTAVQDAVNSGRLATFDGILQADSAEQIDARTLSRMRNAAVVQIGELAWVTLLDLCLAPPQVVAEEIDGFGDLSADGREALRVFIARHKARLSAAAFASDDPPHDDWIRLGSTLTYGVSEERFFATVVLEMTSGTDIVFDTTAAGLVRLSRALLTVALRLKDDVERDDEFKLALGDAAALQKVIETGRREAPGDDVPDEGAAPAEGPDLT